MSSADWAYLIFVILAIGIGSLALLGGGAYVFLRVFSGAMNSRQASWESAAAKIGAAADRNAAGIYKPFIGKRNGIDLIVTHYSIPRGKTTFDDHVQVEAAFRVPLPFHFRIEKPEYAYQQVAKFVERHLVNDSAQSLETKFEVESADRSSLGRLLSADISDGDATTLMVSLLRAGNALTRLIVNETGVMVGVKADLGDAEAIGNAVDIAVHLAERIGRARQAASI